MRDLGAAVRRARREAGLSQQALADRAGVSRQWLSRMEAGKGPSVELGKVLDVLAALGLAVDLGAAPAPGAKDDDPFAGLFQDGT
ncbi:helix-turn-helix domain-containing protein [Ornithinimicrobium sp. LYQ103]|uniref:helix-turn-helix domain-containing protein n=1 Tax=Ornithinimicrobium sp. LYQ103 TaxID=3378796 RepID=UPI003854DD6E